MKSIYVDGAFALQDKESVLLFNPHLSTSAIIPLVDSDIRTSIDTYRNELKKQFVLLPDCGKLSDHNAISEFFTKRDAYNTDILFFTDAMSYDCNFSCVYCMQQNTFKDVAPLSPRDRAQAWETIRRTFNSEGIVPCLFGGEPFLHVEYVKELLENAKNIGIPIRSISAVTNGSLAGNDVLNLIRDYGIRKLQITLDGPKDIHDVRRVAKDKTSSYETIVKNLHVFLRETSVQIIINTVLDKQNCDHYLEMVDELIALFPEYIFGEKPRIIFNLGNECHPFNRSEYTTENILKSNNQKVFFKNIFGLFNRRVCVNSPIPSGRCIATSVNEVVLAPDGDVFQCISGIGNPDLLVAKYDEYTSDSTILLVKQLLLKHPGATASCRTCHNLPLCNGGCKYNKLVEGKASSCQKSDFSFGIDQYVRIAVSVDEVYADVFRLKADYTLELD